MDNIKYIRFSVYIKYWEHCEFYWDGPKTGEDKIPGRDGHYWNGLIDIDSGKFVDWPRGMVGSTYFKVCDGFSCEFISKDNEVIYKVEDIYVPDFMSPRNDGYGDYIFMDIMKDGTIDKWEKGYVIGFFNNCFR